MSPPVSSIITLYLESVLGFGLVDLEIDTHTAYFQHSCHFLVDS